VAVSTVACFLEYQSMRVFLARCKMPVTDLPVMRVWCNQKLCMALWRKRVFYPITITITITITTQGL